MKTEKNTSTRDEAEIRRLITDWTSDLRGVGTSPLQDAEPAGWRRPWDAYLPCLLSSLQPETRDLKITVSGDVALGHWLWRLTVPKNDHPALQTWIRTAAGYKKHDGRWQLAHEHCSGPFLSEKFPPALARPL